MKKMTTRLLALVMALALLAVPASALTNGMASTELGNFAYSVNGQDEAIDALGRMSVGLSADGRMYLSGEASGVSPIGGATVGFGEEIKFYVNGMTHAYSITQDELMDMMKEQMGPTEAELMTVMGELMGAYVQMLADAMDPAIQAGMQAPLNEFVQGLIENGTALDEARTMDVLGAEAQMHGVHFVIGSAEFDRMFEIEGQYSPGTKKFIDAYLKLIPLALDDDAPVPQTLMEGLHALGMDLRFDVTAWLNESGDTSLIEMNYIMTLPDNSGHGIRETVTMPIAIATRVEGDKASIELNMHMEQAGAYVSYHIVEVVEPDAMELKLIADFVQKDAERKEIVDGFEVTVDIAHQVDGDGAETLDGAMQVMGHGLGVPYADVKLRYAGTRTEEGDALAREGRMTIDAKTEENDQPHEVTLSFDLAQYAGPDDGAALTALDERPAIKIADMDEDQMAQLQKELGAAGMTAMGGLMRIPAVARSISKLMTEMQKFSMEYSGTTAANHTI